MLIIVDGIDGSGKSSVIKAWKEQLAHDGNAIFDLKDYWLSAGRYPDYSELKSYDFIFSAEPTEVGIGRVIRDELIKNGTSYPPRAIAEAYALDRLVLYTKIIIPALKDGKCVIQDRGVTSSLAYQPLSDKKLTRKFLSELPGNALALKYRPDHLILLISDAKLAIQRLASRTEKRDNVVFERVAFQTKLAHEFASKNYQSFIAKLGTKIHQLPADVKLAILQQEACKLLTRLLPK